MIHLIIDNSTCQISKLADEIFSSSFKRTTSCLSSGVSLMTINKDLFPKCQKQTLFLLILILSNVIFIKPYRSVEITSRYDPYTILRTEGTVGWMIFHIRTRVSTFSLLCKVKNLTLLFYVPSSSMLQIFEFQ